MSLIINSLIVSFVLSIISFSLVNLTVFLNINYNIFNVLFRSIPFKVSYVPIYNYETIILFSIIILLSLLSTYVSLLSINRFKLNNNANT
jgi:hypothetical protein